VTIVSLVLLSAPDAGKYLGISTRKIYDLVEPKGPILATGSASALGGLSDARHIPWFSQALDWY
jgi:hypothetical protein